MLVLHHYMVDTPAFVKYIYLYIKKKLRLMLKVLLKNKHC